MPCYKPLSAYQPAPGGKVYFAASRKNPSDKSIQFQCGQCWGCRLERSRQWAIRCVHEASLHEENSFLTLTYDDEHYPQYGSLQKEHFTKFMKRLRLFIEEHTWNGEKYVRNASIKVFNAKTKKYKNKTIKCYNRIRFYMCGEYGSQLKRPHYHAIIFGYDDPGKELYSQKEGISLYTSDLLSNIWGMGFVTTGEVTFESAAYVARYIMKKIKVSDKSPENYKHHYESVDQYGEIHELEPEYTNQSRRPGIANNWITKWTDDVFPSDFVTHEGRTLRTPRYYDEVYDTFPDSNLKEIKKCRIEKARKQHSNNTPERLAIREKVALKNHKLFKTRDYENDY